MTTNQSKTGKKAGKQEIKAVTFICRCCQEEKPLEKMRSITRFFPPLIVCEECERIIR